MTGHCHKLWYLHAKTNFVFICVPVFHIFYSLLICMYYPRPDDIILSGSFSSICQGFCFVPYDSIIEEVPANDILF